MTEGGKKTEECAALLTVR